MTTSSGYGKGSKVRVIEVEATKLDPNAVYLIVFHQGLLSKVQMRDTIEQLNELGVKAAYQMSIDPENALKVYQIPDKEIERDRSSSDEGVVHDKPSVPPEAKLDNGGA